MRGLNQFNTSWPIENGRILYELFPASFLSVLTNFFIIFLCFTSPILKEHSRYFIAHTALLDLAYSFGMLLYGAYFAICYIFELEMSAIFCTFFHIILYFFGSAVLLSYVATVLCRYRQVLLKRPCAKNRIFCLILYPYTILSLYLLNHWILADKLAPAYANCKIVYFSKLTSLLINCWVLISLGVQMALSLKLYAHLRNHFKTISANLRSNRSCGLERARTENSILKAISIQGFAPVILAMPMVIRLHFEWYLQADMDENLIFGIPPRDFTVFVYNSNPLVDSLAVLFVMIPYTKARKKCMRNLRAKLKQIVAFA